MPIECPSFLSVTLGQRSLWLLLYFLLEGDRTGITVTSIYMCVFCDHNQQHQQPAMNGPGSLFSFLFFPLILFFSSSNYRLNIFPSVQSFKRTEKEMQGLSDCDSDCYEYEERGVDNWNERTSENVYRKKDRVQRVTDERKTQGKFASKREEEGNSRQNSMRGDWRPSLLTLDPRSLLSPLYSFLCFDKSPLPVFASSVFFLLYFNLFSWRDRRQDRKNTMTGKEAQNEAENEICDERKRTSIDWTTDWTFVKEKKEKKSWFTVSD